MSGATPESDVTIQDAIRKEIDQAPEPLLREVLDFVHFLKSKLVRERFESTMASEPSLARDWLRPEEDAAWQDL